MAQGSGSNRVPPALRKLLNFDAELTEKLLLWINSHFKVSSFKTHCKALEISCHGIPWFAFWIAFSWLFNNTSLIQLQVNMLIGLFVDIVLVAVSKAYFRRKRPMANKDDALGQIGPDVFSFPSGHASRAVFVTFFFIRLYPVNILFAILLLTWCTSVCVSRVLMSRHYILDVLGGCVLGIIDGIIMSILWLENDTAVWIMSFLSDEKLDGGEYHV